MGINNKHAKGILNSFKRNLEPNIVDQLYFASSKKFT